MIEVYFDGSCLPVNPGGVATYGFIIYADGRKVAEGKGLATEPWSDKASNNVAEYVGIIKALEWLNGNGYSGSEILVRGDSRLSINQMQGLYKVRAWRILPLYQKLQKLLVNFKKIKFEWIPREENKEADALSRLAYDSYVSSHPGIFKDRKMRRYWKDKRGA